ncbi:MAG: hypothetical protein QXU32_09170 [Nitrososphaerales archaeon]
MAEYEQLIYSIKGNIDRFNKIFRAVNEDGRDYDMLLECYAEDIYEMCRKFYEANAGKAGICTGIKEDYNVEGEVD